MTSVPDAVKHYDGTKSKFNGMDASLLVFLGAADFILTSAPSHCVTLSEALKADSDSSALEFEKYFRPMNLRIGRLTATLSTSFCQFSRNLLTPKNSCEFFGESAQDHSQHGLQHCQNTRPRCQLPPSPFGLSVRPAVDNYWPKMQKLHWLSSALRLLRRPAALYGVRNSLLFAANPATKPCSAMLMLSLTLTKLPISGWRLLLVLLQMTQQQTVLNVFKCSSQNASPPFLSILVPILKTTPNFASVILWTPIPSYYFATAYLLFQVCFDCSSSCDFEFYGVYHFLEGDTQS